MKSISIIIPARNEEKYITEIVKQISSVPFVCDYEIIFIEGHSNDSTLSEIKRVAEEYKNRIDIRYFLQDGIGKADAIWKGLNMAKNDILMILDADLTVQAGELPKFYKAIINSGNVLVNGSRLVLPMEKGAMRPMNYLGNKVFSTLLGVIIGQKLTDTLCGTKAILKSDYVKIKNMGLIDKLDDPFCDFTLLLGASRLGLKIVEVPIYYKRRIYDDTKIRRFKDGWKLLKIIVRHMFV